MIGSLTLDQLRVLVAIAETGSFSAAGRQLRRVQSAISSAVQLIESSQHLALFDRSERLPRLTEAGRVLVVQARQVLRQAEIFENIAASIAAGVEPELALALDSLVPGEPLRRSLAALHAAYPDLPVTLYTEGAWGSERRVRDRSAALAVAAIHPSVPMDLQAFRLMTLTLVPVASPEHPLARQQGTLSRDALAEHVQLVLTNPNQEDRPSQGVVSPAIWRFADLGQRMEYLLAGFGWGTMPHHLVEGALSEGRLRLLDVEDPAVLPGKVSIYAVHARDRALGSAARWLLDRLVNEVWLEPGSFF